MQTSFLDYYKMILEKVSFDRQLFRKEYYKAIKILKQHEVQQLDQWLKYKGLHIYSSPNQSLNQDSRISA